MLRRPSCFSPLAVSLAANLLVLLSTDAACGQEKTSDQAEIVHVLNRITFGPRPGDVGMVQKMGLHNYIEQQLHPETIDDSAVEQILSHFDLLQMTPEELTQLYIDERALNKQKKIVAGEKKQAAAQNQAPGQTPTAGQPPSGNQTDAMQPLDKDKAGAAAGPDQIEPQAPPMPPPPGRNPKDKLAAMVATASQYRTVAAVGQIEQAKLVRAIESQRQLQEVLADFWNNHFNIDVKNKECSVYKIPDDRDVIRPRIWGKFRDLLEASAKSPAMLFYLNNATNTKEREVSPMEQQRQQQRQAEKMNQMLGAAAPPAPAPVPLDQLKTKKQGGINENYARELMELHTLGVDGGYTQQDVQEVARCFTGWSVDRQTGTFIFNARVHDNGPKVVLGHNLPAGGGINDGEMVLDILCAHPACAHHISLELCQRFVSDAPSAALVDRIAGVFTKTGGDLRQVTEAILTSPEFLSPATYGNKIKSPLEFTVSAVRASDSTFIAQQPPPYDKLVPTQEGGAVMGRSQAADRLSQRPRQSLNWHIYELGEPLFACTPPTGYNEVSSAWVSPGALIERLNFAMALTDQKLSDVRFDPAKILSGTDLDKPEDVLNQCVSVFLQNNISDTTRKVLEQTALPAPGNGQTVNPTKLIALIIGSPEFQRK